MQRHDFRVIPKAMAKSALPMFTRDHTTGSMKEWTPSQTDGFAQSQIEASPEYFHVLVVVDDESDRLLTVWNVGQAWPPEKHILVDCATDSAEALDKIHSKEFGLIVLDLSVPNQEGAEVLCAIREKNLRVPVVALSGPCTDATASDLESMAAAFISKDHLDPTSFRNAI